jgi:hypothetical protein
MSLIEKIPTMSDADVDSLLANARRLAESGDGRQKAAAGELLPALETESAQRAAARAEITAAKRAAAPRRKKAAPAA